MNWLPAVFWACLLCGGGFCLGQQIYVHHLSAGNYCILDLELSSSYQLVDKLRLWSSQWVAGKSLLAYARTNTWVDFIFIFGYVGVLIRFSYSAMQRVPNASLNNLFRFFILLALLIGFLDVVENVMLLWDFRFYQILLFVPKWVSFIKLFFTSGMVLALVLSAVKREDRRDRAI